MWFLCGNMYCLQTTKKVNIYINMDETIHFNKTKESELRQRNIVIGKNVKIGSDVKLGCNVCLLGETTIGDNSIIFSNSVIENCVIGSNVVIRSSMLENCRVDNSTEVGPFAHIRSNAIIGENCRIGNFVEIKNSIISNNCKIAHLSYVGDAEIGEHCNIGCGVVFCNYNGIKKQKSHIGNFAFIGSNSNIVAPVNIEDYTYIAAGSTITKDVKKDELAIARAHQVNKENFKNPYKEKFK